MRIVILGGGISGLIAARAIIETGRAGKPHQNEVIIVESSKVLGGTFTNGGLKYLAATDDMKDLLGRMGVAFSCESVLGAVWSDGTAHPHPRWMMSIGTVDRLQVQLAHWLKTRGSLEGFRADCMNDPADENKSALLCDISEFIKKLAWDAFLHCNTFMETRVERICPRFVHTQRGRMEYDALINTIPLNVIKGLVTPDLSSGIPASKCNKISIVDVEGVDTEMWWDYLYTPFLPNVSRITRTSITGAQVEMPWSTVRPSMTVEDMTPLTRGSNRPLLLNSRGDINGHLVPLQQPIRTPKNWLMLGRYAEWDPRSTVDKTLEKMIQWRAENV